MGAPITTAGVAAPGFLGLNTQDSEVTLENGYATEANNCIIDRYGRLGSRRGYQVLTTDNASLDNDQPIKAIFEFKDVNGVITYLSAGAGKLFTGLDTLVEKTLRNASNDDDIPLVSSTDNWQIAGLTYGTGVGAEAQAFLAQRGSPLIVWNNPSSSYVFQRVGDVGAVPSGLTVSDFDPNCILSAYGRLWTADLSNNKHTIFYSALLEGWDFAGTGSGLLDISSVVGNNDEIVALSNHNGFLIVFCQNNIVVYADADDPTNIRLADVITGVGCIARDSIAKTGTDLIFLSKSGVRSLARTIQEKSMPMRELSTNVRDELIDDLGNETLANIKSIYYERDAFYLLHLPATNVIYYFDLRRVLENGASRTTKWTELPYFAFCTTEDRKLLLGVAGGIAQYSGYLDNGSSFRMTYYTPNSDMGAPSTLKFLKRAKLIAIGNNTQDFVIKYAYDYSTTYSSRVYFNSFNQTLSEYNIAEYGIGEYTGGLNIITAKVNLGGSGEVVKFGVETVIDGAPVSIQKADVYVTTGKII